MKSIFIAVAISLAVGVGPTLAQSDTKTDNKTQMDTKTKSTDPNKAAIAKSCIDQANAKGLHGEARKKFKSKCKKAGGKPL